MPFRFLMSGESHGQCLSAILEGVPSGFPLSEEDINIHLKRRQLGYGRGGRMKIESDQVKICSGVRHGFTTGAPINLIIENKDWQNWLSAMSIAPVDSDDAQVQEKMITKVRPGHADLAGALKYNHSDVRNILERSSARETAIRVAVGAVALKILSQFGIDVFSHVTCIGGINSQQIVDYTQAKTKAESSDVRCCDERASGQMKELIDKAKEDGDSLGGIFEVVATGVPVGMGSFVHWDRRLDAQIAQAIMSIPAIKSIEIGEGDKAAHLPGSQFHDEIFPKENGEYIRKTNNCGGIEGGMSNGMPIVVRATMKAIPTIQKPLRSVNIETGEEHIAHYERSDVCAVPAAGVVGEAMLAIVLLEAFIDKFGGDSFEEQKANFANYKLRCQKR